MATAAWPSRLPWPNGKIRETVQMTRSLRTRPWLPDGAATRIDSILGDLDGAADDVLDRRVHDLVDRNREIHERSCVNLNPAANVMNPRAEALLSAGLGSRPSLGYAGEKYETGLEAVEEIEVIAAELTSQVFRAPFVEIRIPSGAIANLMAFLACTSSGDSVIVPPASIAGHVTHHLAGAAGLRGLVVHEAPIDPDRYTVDVDGLRRLALDVRPTLISLGGSLNLTHHPVAAVRRVADEVGATVLFDAAHLGGLIAGGAWPDPLADGAHVMTMSTYKSLGGPPSGLLVTTQADIAERVEAIAYPGLTANFDAAKSAALAITLLDWRSVGAAYADEMVRSASRLADELLGRELPVRLADGRPTLSHAFALTTADGDALARRLRRSNLLTSAIGVPPGGPGGDGAVRLGTNEAVRWGMTVDDMPELARLLAAAIRSDDPESLADEVAAFRRPFDRVHFVR